MTSVVEIGVRNKSGHEKDFKLRIQISFPEDAEILKDSVLEQMMMDGYELNCFGLDMFINHSPLLVQILASKTSDMD
jgi:hypothetical protein